MCDLRTLAVVNLEVNRLFEGCDGNKKQRGGGNYMAGQNNNENNTE